MVTTGQADPTEQEQVPVFVISTVALGTAGNVLALFILLCSSNNFRIVFYRLIGILIFTDLLATLMTSPVTLLAHYGKINLETDQRLCHYNSFVIIFFGLATAFVVSVMGMERYLALLHPSLYVEKVTTSRIAQTLIGLYVAAFIVASLPLIGLGRNVPHYPKTWCLFDYDGKTIEDGIFTYLYSCVGLLMVFLLLLTNVTLLCAFCKRRNPMITIAHVFTESTPIMERQMLIFLTGFMLAYTISWFPLIVMILIKQTGSPTISNNTALVIIRIVSFNQIVDPWVFILCREKLVMNVFSLFRRKRRRCDRDQDAASARSIEDVALPTISGTLHSSETATTELDMEIVPSSLQNGKKDDSSNGQVFHGNANGCSVEIELHAIPNGTLHIGNGSCHFDDVRTVNKDATNETRL